MRYVYFDVSSGLSGDMILGALLDLGVPFARFQEKMAELRLPVKITTQEVKRSGIRGLKVGVKVDRSKTSARKWIDVQRLIRDIPFSDGVKKNSLAVFKKLFQAESRAHGSRLQDTHLHEAGADDAIVDIVGACYLSEELEIRRFYASPLNLGQGWVKTSHGILPVPPPAVGELLKGIPVYSAWASEELVTPTGAAIVTTFVDRFCRFPEICYEKIGYGAGSRDLPDIPNLLRAFYGQEKDFIPDRPHWVIEANIDDSSPQVLAGFFDKALKAGANDVFLTPVVMKKNRLGSKLTVLAQADKMDALIRAVFTETHSIGVRYYPVERRVLDRQMSRVKIFGEEVGMKTAFLEGEVVNVQPEHSDCVRVAKKTQRPVKKIIELALAEWTRRHGQAAGRKT